MKTTSVVRTTCTIALLLTILCAFSFTKETHTASASQDTKRAWRVVSSPNSPQTFNNLNGVVALSANDVWSVGTDVGFTVSSQPLIERWNGTHWHIVLSPTITASGQLNAVARIPGTQKLWAVGTQSNSSNGPQPLIERWDGTTWSVVPSPILNEDPMVMTNILYGITALSANDAWAVGVYYQSGSLPQEALIEHWDGNQWSVVPAATPAGSTFSWLYGIAAFSAKDIWTVGTSSPQAGGRDTVLINHWNGTAWSLVSGPNPGTNANFLYAVAPVPGTNQLWAVGNYLTSGAYQTLIERWNGTTWNLVTSPSPGSNGNGLQGVTALSATGAWAVGSYTNGNGDLILIEHWNGTNWSIVASPNPSLSLNFLSAVARVPHTSKLWAVGNYYDTNNNDLTLTELYS